MLAALPSAALHACSDRTQVILNPFYTPSSPITSPDFRARVRAIAKRYL